MTIVYLIAAAWAVSATVGLGLLGCLAYQVGRDRLKLYRVDPPATAIKDH